MMDIDKKARRTIRRRQRRRKRRLKGIVRAAVTNGYVMDMQDLFEYNDVTSNKRPFEQIYPILRSATFHQFYWKNRGINWHLKYVLANNIFFGNPLEAFS